MPKDSTPPGTHLPAPLSPRAVRSELETLGRGARKRLGQHFLTNRHVAERIVRVADLTGAETVVEIGPGLGALTDALAAESRELWLVEVDAELAERARTRFASTAGVRLVVADALRVDFRSLLGDDANAVLVANLPYNVATEIMMRLMEPPSAFRRMVVMIQLEVALRMAAAPGSKTYGVLSVMAQLSARMRVALRVPPTAFTPRPKVDSAVIIIEPRDEPPVAIANRELFKRVVRTAFGQRRKHLSNSLRALAPDVCSVLKAAGIDPARRPETLSLGEFAAFANLLHAQPQTSVAYEPPADA